MYRNLLYSILLFGLVASSTVDVLLIGDSLCPGTEYVIKEHLKPALKRDEIGKLFNVRTIWTGHSYYDRKLQSLVCLHGEKECLGNVVHTCESEYSPSSILEMVLCHTLMLDFSDATIRWCGSLNGIEEKTQDKILECVANGEGVNIIRKFLKTTPRLSEMPALFVNDKQIIDFKDHELQAMVCEMTPIAERPNICSKRIRQNHFDVYDPVTADFCYSEKTSNNWRYYDRFYNDRVDVTSSTTKPFPAQIAKPATTSNALSSQASFDRPKTMTGWFELIKEKGILHVYRDFVSNDGPGWGREDRRMKLEEARAHAKFVKTRG